MDQDQRVAVAALVEQFELELERAATIAFSDDAGTGGKHRGQRRRQLWSEAARAAIGRIDEDQIVLTRGTACALEEA
jgi:hypothetical protein